MSRAGRQDDTGKEFVTKPISKSLEVLEVPGGGRNLSLIHISEPTRLGMISYAVFCLNAVSYTHLTLPTSDLV